jgi:putative transposase
MQQRNGEVALCGRMRELALRHPRYGYRRVGVLLGQEGWRVNAKRVHRLWRKEGLKVRQKQVKRSRLREGSSANACHRMRAQRMDEVWSFDFCFDRTADGRALKVFSVIDEFTRRCLEIEVGHRMTGADVVRTLKALMKGYGSPEHLRCDNGRGRASPPLRSSWARR